jgi:hypothetical protein
MDRPAGARPQGGLPADAPVIEYPSVDQTLLEKALELVGLRAGTISIAGLPVQVKNVARAIAPMAIHRPEIPLARAEWVPLEDVGNDDEK